MALTQIPWSMPETPVALTAKPVPPREPEFRPLLLDQRYRREHRRLQWTLWVSVAVHAAVLVAASLLQAFLPPAGGAVVVPAEALRNRNLTFLEPPPDQAPLVKPPPDTSIISDRDRVASSRKPTIDKKTLDEILARRLGPPGASAPPSPATPSAPRTESASGTPEPLGPRQQESPVPQQKPAEGQTARVQAPPAAAQLGRGFGGGMSPGSALEQAARASAGNRGGFAGSAGDYGLGRGTSSVSTGQGLDVLSDTMGVDFAPYLQRVVHQVRINWYNLIPEVARAPLRKKGKASIEFAILKDGGIAGMKLVTPSGDVALDRAAWGGITASNPFPPLPSEFSGQYLYLRFHFYYNPEQNELK